MSSEESLEQESARRREKRQRREQGLRREPLSPQQKNEKMLREEAIKERPRAFLFELGIVACQAMVKAPRDAYTCEPTTPFSFFYRPVQARAKDQLSAWYGFRIHPFVGSGFYDARPGRYGLTYFGPMVGLGNIAAKATPQGSGGRPASGTKRDEITPVYTGNLVSLGLSLMASSGTHEARENSETSNDDDFTRKKGVKFDTPGLSVEYRHLRVYHGALGLDLLVGSQFGRGKSWIYAGLGFGAWY